jgi:hypothetical protein
MARVRARPQKLLHPGTRPRYFTGAKLKARDVRKSGSTKANRLIRKYEAQADEWLA